MSYVTWSKVLFTIFLFTFSISKQNSLTCKVSIWTPLCVSYHISKNEKKTFCHSLSLLEHPLTVIYVLSSCVPVSSLYECVALDTHFGFGFGLYWRPCSAHADYIGTDRSLLTEHNAPLLRHIARDLLHALSHKHDNTWHGLCWTSWQHCGRTPPFWNKRNVLGLNLDGQLDRQRR